MDSTLNVVVLSKLRYADNDLIVRCYSKEKGIVSFILKGVYKRKKGKVNLAAFQVLSLLEVEVNPRNKGNLQSLKEVKVTYNYNSLTSNVYKSSIAMFLAEVLSSVLKEEEANLSMFNYISTSFQYLDHQSDFANFHLLFLLNLTKYLGCYPDISKINHDYFSLDKGKFTNQQVNMYTISGQNLTVLKQLLGTNFEALNNIRLNSMQRQSFLGMLLLYFELHLGDFKKPKSLEVFNQVFH